MKDKVTARNWSAVMLAPGVVLAVVFIILPFVLAIVLSFTNQRLVPNLNVPTSFVGLRNYARLFLRDEFWQALYNTSLFVLIIVPLQSAIALAVALLINSRLPGRNLFRGVYFLPTVITMIVVSVIWSVLFRIDGTFNHAIELISFGQIDAVDWLDNEATALPAIIVLSAWEGFPFQMVIYLAGLQAINPELYEAARVEGSSRWQAFCHVTFPCLRNTHIFIVVATTILGFRLFTQVNLLTQGGPRGATETMVLQIYRMGFERGRVGYAAALSVVFFTVVLGVSLVQRTLLRSEEEI